MKPRKRYAIQALTPRGAAITVEETLSRNIAKIKSANLSGSFVRNLRTNRVWCAATNKWVSFETYHVNKGLLGILAPTPRADSALDAMGAALGLHLMAGGTSR